MKPGPCVWLSFLLSLGQLSFPNNAHAEVEFLVQNPDGQGIRSVVDVQRTEQLHRRGTTDQKGFLADGAWNCERGDLVVARPTLEFAPYYAIQATADCDTPISHVVIARVQRGVRRVVVLIDRDAPDDAYWRLVNAGLTDAATELSMQLERYWTSQLGSGALAALLMSAANADVEGVVLAIPDERVVGIRHDALARTPIVAINAGEAVKESINLLANLGQGDYETGLAAGEQMKRLGVRRSLCLNTVITGVDHEARCRGFADGVEGSVETVRVSNDRREIVDILRRKFSGRSGLQGLLITSPDIAEQTMSAVEGANVPGHIEVGTIDLTGRILEAITRGAVSFSVDRQPYSVGYLSLVALNLHRKAGFQFPQAIAAGPAFVTESNVGEVIGLSARGIR